LLRQRGEAVLMLLWRQSFACKRWEPRHLRSKWQGCRYLNQYSADAATIVCLQTMKAAPSKCPSNDRPLVCIAESPEFGLIMGPGKAPGAVWSCRLAARLGGVVLLYCESGSGASLDACDRH
jgi:hypothetical protein